MRIIEYQRHEFHSDPENRKSKMSIFVYDIPYFGACGIFPPFHIINEIFQTGGSQGGMSPGATWQPFQIEQNEYDELVQTIKTLDPETLGDNARYTWVKFEFDSSMACISANKAISDAVNLIQLGEADIMLAGGVELLSDVPIGFKKEVRKRFYESRKFKSALEWRKFMKGLKASDLVPIAPAIAEFSTGEVMGESADKLAAAFGVSRQEQDEYALATHQAAADAQEKGYLAQSILALSMPPKFKSLETDNTIRTDSSIEKLARLKPAFVKPFGTVTAGNSSPLTDGAAATLLMSEDKAKALGYVGKARLVDYVFVAQDPKEELLLGPAYATPKLLARNGLSLNDIDVIEIHEAFAGQVLAVFNALESDKFAKEKLGLEQAVGRIDRAIVNNWGGSISLGHPFGATGARLMTMAAQRLAVEDGKYALVTACAAGGMAYAGLLERY